MPAADWARHPFSLHSAGARRRGEVDGVKASIYALRNRNGLTARITDFGAVLVELLVPDRNGELADVVLGFDSLDDYRERNSPYFGSTVGRVANRIAFGRFELDGKEYRLVTNFGRHHIHGGEIGFNRVLWHAESEETPEGPKLRLSYRSIDGEEGYPGSLDAAVVYTLTQNDELRIEMSATTDMPTIVNLVHHSYWNLAGHDRGDIRDHRIELNASRYTPSDQEGVPTGAVEAVDGTPFDLRVSMRLGDALDRFAASVEREPSGFDDNLLVEGEVGKLRRVARVEEPSSGRVMVLETDQPGVELYTANYLDGIAGKGGAIYEQHAGLCLETQNFPDAIHKLGRESWQSPILRPGETYRHVIVHRFSTME